MKNPIIFFILFNFNICSQNCINSKININNTRNNKSNSQITFNYFYKKNLIVSILIRFSWEKILPFIKSLIKANLNNCDTVIFVREIKASIIKNLKSYGIIVHEIPNKFENILVYNYRWKIYNDFLKSKRGKYNLVLSVDIKDSIIQNDIFSLYQDYEHFLGFSYEDSTINEGVTGKIILATFGTELFDRIKNEKIINAGIIWGKEYEFFRFSQILWENLLIYPQVDDQCIVNYLVYHKNIFKDFIVFSDNYGPVITIGLTKRNHINLDTENNILNFRNQIVSIVHQYDRHEDIKSKIKEKYCPELISSKNHFRKTSIY